MFIVHMYITYSLFPTLAISLQFSQHNCALLCAENIKGLGNRRKLSFLSSISQVRSLSMSLKIVSKTAATISNYPAPISSALKFRIKPAYVSYECIWIGVTMLPFLYLSPRNERQIPKYPS